MGDIATRSLERTVSRVGAARTTSDGRIPLACAANLPSDGPGDPASRSIAPPIPGSPAGGGRAASAMARSPISPQETSPGRVPPTDWGAR